MVKPPHSYHSIPQRWVVRALDGEWRFKADPEDEGETQRWYRSGVEDWICTVSSPWQFIFEDLREYKDPIWYERELTISPNHKNEQVTVVFL